MPDEAQLARKRKRSLNTKRPALIRPARNQSDLYNRQDASIAQPEKSRDTVNIISRSIQRSAHGRISSSVTIIERERATPQPNEEVSTTCAGPEGSIGASADSASASAFNLNDHVLSQGLVADLNEGLAADLNEGLAADLNEGLAADLNEDETPSIHPQQFWAAQRRQTYLEELYQLDGRGTQSHLCVNDENEGRYRCIDCFETALYCRACILHRHSCSPLHRIEAWTDQHCFVRTPLSSLGLVVQLGHHNDTCALPSKIRKDFYVIDTTGIHVVLVQFCGCCFLSEDIQLIRHRWYPATSTAPRTVFTLDLLNTFHLITLQGKLSAYDFYRSIERKTNNTGILNLQSRYNQFLVCVRQFRHLRMLKRAGLGMDTEPVSSTKDGACAVDCPACPHPGINLPSGWESQPESTRWLYGLNLTIDANFRLKNKDRHLERDEPLGDGWGHWVPAGPYKSHLQAHADEPEPNLCDSELRAVDHANKRRSNGYTSTGVAGVICARHGLVRRNGLGNLQKGERYANTDFVVLSTLKDMSFARLVLSYDICCQWLRNLKDRVAAFPESMRLSEDAFKRTTFVIPKFHLYAHGPQCQIAYSLSYLPWSAETDGEDPERWWSHINPVSMSTKIMGPGSRMDTIDDHAAAWNWRKIVALGDSLHERFCKAVLMSARHTALHAEYTAEFDQAQITAWQQTVTDWESDRSKPNPFEEKEIYSSMAQVRLELAREEVIEAPRTQSLSANEFLYKGLELEESQRVIATYQKEKTTLQAAELQEKRNNLGYRIELWRTEQREHMPSIATDLESRPGPIPEKVPLLLPSAFPPSAELASLQTREVRIRIAQADDSLLDLRRLLQITAGLSDYKYTQIGFGQGPNTRARSQIARFKVKVTFAAERYRAAYRVLLALDPQGAWMTRLRKLEDSDIRWPTRDPDEAEGTREISWIWRAHTARPTPAHQSAEPSAPQPPSQSQPSGAANLPLPHCASNSEIGEALRVEWAKSYARANRWGEEVSLVLEEMRRVAMYLEWKSGWWRGRRGQRRDVSSELQEGINAYATRQATTLSNMRARFAALWLPDIHGHNMTLQNT